MRYELIDRATGVKVTADIVMEKIKEFLNFNCHEAYPNFVVMAALAAVEDEDVLTGDLLDRYLATSGYSSNDFKIIREFMVTRYEMKAWHTIRLRRDC